jgi:hypothetical protein
LIACDFAEVAFGFEYAGRGPSENHHPALPALDPARDLARPTEQVLDQIGRREDAFKVSRPTPAKRIPITTRRYLPCETVIPFQIRLNFTLTLFRQAVF